MFYLILFLNLASAAEVNLSFEDLPKLIREKNKNVEGAVLARDAAQIKTGHLLRSYLPSIKGHTGAETFETGVYTTQTQPIWGVEANINIYRGGKDFLEDKVRSSQANAANASLQRTFSNELQTARKLYWQIVSNRESIRSLKASLEQNDRNLAMANRRISRGLSSETDRLEFQIHKNQLKEEIESIEHDTTLLQISLSAILGAEKSTMFKTAEVVPHVHDEELLKKKVEIEKHPDYVFLKFNHESLYSQHRQLGRWWLPSIDVYASQQLFNLRERDFLTESDRIDTVAGARLTLEFDFVKAAESSSLGLQAQGIEKQSQQKARSLESDVEVAKEELKHDHELIHYSEERVEQGKKYLARVLDEYNRGVKNSVDVLSAAQRYLTFQREFTQRRTNYQIRKSGVLFLFNEF